MHHDILKLTKTERLHYRFFTDAMRQLDYDLRHNIWAQKIIPREWHKILKDEPVSGKTRVTIRLDSDLVKFFRKLGPGYQTQINRVLRAFVKARMANFVMGPEGLDEIAFGLIEDRQGDKRPQIGDFERVIDAGREEME